MDDRHVGTRTPDLYRVKSQVKPLQPFSCLAFPFSETRKTPLKQPILGDELVTSFLQINPPIRIFCKEVFGTRLGRRINASYSPTGYREWKRNGFDSLSDLPSISPGAPGLKPSPYRNSRPKPSAIRRNNYQRVATPNCDPRPCTQEKGSIAAVAKLQPKKMWATSPGQARRGGAGPHSGGHRAQDRRTDAL